MGRTVLVLPGPLAVIAVTWLRFESPRDELWRVVALLVIALATSLVRPFAARVAAAAVALLAAVEIAFGLSPLQAGPLDVGHDFFGPLGSRFANGFLEFYDVKLPFDPRLHADMRSVVLIAIFAFALALGLAVASRRLVVALLVLLVGAGWPATLAGNRAALAEGIAILVAALVVLAGLTRRRVPRAALPAAASLALAAALLSTTSAVARPGMLAWQKWHLYTAPDQPVAVSFVWKGYYDGIAFPAKKTTVLEVQAPRTASLYWRAAVLDTFAGGAWIEASPRPGDSLEPPAAYRRRNQTKQVVTVRALSDVHLVGGSAPIAFDAGGAPVVRPAPGFALLPSGLTRGFRYTVWSYAPQPSPAQLRRSAPTYPDILTEPGGFLDVWPGVAMPAFGTAGRPSRVAAVISEHPKLIPYSGLDQTARQVAGRARTPYDAAVALESWFRTPGRFLYSDHPPIDPVAPLESFVTATHTGYCQHFAGAMALMLRYLGVPARVAVGFSSGIYDSQKHAWIVTDHDAHAWVEAWFRGYGWLPFDPTPSTGRPEQGVLSGRYSASSPGFGAGRTRTGGGAVGSSSSARGSHAPIGGGISGEVGTGASSGSSGRHLGLVLLAAVLALAGAAGAGAMKVVLRRAGLRSRDPRRVAAACHRELVGFLVDQRIDAARGATLRELGTLLRTELYVDAGRFVAVAEAARFGPPAGAVAAARAARHELRLLVRDIRSGLSESQRFRGLVSLRSLGSTT